MLPIEKKQQTSNTEHRALNIELQTSRVTRSVLRGNPLPIVGGELKFRGSHILLEMLKR